MDNIEKKQQKVMRENFLSVQFIGIQILEIYHPLPYAPHRNIFLYRPLLWHLMSTIHCMRKIFNFTEMLIFTRCRTFNDVIIRLAPSLEKNRGVYCLLSTSTASLRGSYLDTPYHSKRIER